MTKPNTELVDPLGDDWDARSKRGQARQREQSVETHAGEWIRADVIEAILVNLARTCHGILAGIPDSLRSCGATSAMIEDAGRIVDTAKTQIADALSGVAEESAAHVETMEREIEEAADSLALQVTGPKERKAQVRKPRGVARMKKVK